MCYLRCSLLASKNPITHLTAGEVRTITNFTAPLGYITFCECLADFRSLCIEIVGEHRAIRQCAYTYFLNGRHLDDRSVFDRLLPREGLLSALRRHSFARRAEGTPPRNSRADSAPSSTPERAAAKPTRLALAPWTVTIGRTHVDRRRSHGPEHQPMSRETATPRGGAGAAWWCETTKSRRRMRTPEHAAPTRARTALTTSSTSSELAKLS